MYRALVAAALSILISGGASALDDGWSLNEPDAYLPHVQGSIAERWWHRDRHGQWHFVEQMLVPEERGPGNRSRT
jgi:hypothetical protein